MVLDDWVPSARGFPIWYVPLKYQYTVLSFVSTENVGLPVEPGWRWVDTALHASTADQSFDPLARGPPKYSKVCVVLIRCRVCLPLARNPHELSEHLANLIMKQAIW